VVEKMKRQYKDAVSDLLTPIADWLTKREIAQPLQAQRAVQA
jgi:hypothetical protein